MAQGHRWTPTENRRSDPVLFEFIQNLASQGEMGDSLTLARAQFSTPLGPCRYSLSISHAVRMAVNRAENQRTKPPEAIKYTAPANHGDNASQTMWVWPGQELIGAAGRCRKGVFYTVVACSPERMTVCGNGESLTMTSETAVRCLRLTHCLTYASCQGLSLASVRLLETSSPYFTWKHLYVGMSRCTNHATLQVS